MSNRDNKNAIKHGAFSEAVLLPGEDPKEFQGHLSAVYDEYKPEGTSEIDKVYSIALGLWRKRRFRLYARRKIARSAEKENALKAVRKRSLFRLLELVELLPTGVITQDDLSKKLAPTWFNELKSKCPREKYQSDKAWGEAVAGEIQDVIDRRYIEELQEETLLDDLSDELFEDKERRFEERLDAKIDRDIKQLGQIKTMKAIGVVKPREPFTASGN
jgi:hypothetical protein